MTDEPTKRLQTPISRLVMIGVPVLALLGAVGYSMINVNAAKPVASEVSSQSRQGPQRYTPTAAEWASISIQPCAERAFRAEYVTEGKIAIDEDRSTPVFSPYTGRVIRLLVRPGDVVVKGQPLFVIDRRG